MLNDIRYAARKLLRAPGFTAIAIFTLTLGIGATTAIFSVVDGIVLRPLAVHEPERVVAVQTTSARDGGATPMSAPDFLDYRAQSRAFASMAVVNNNGSVNLTGSGADPEQLRSARVSADFWQTIGVTPQVGRGFRLEEGKPGAPRVAILSDAVWHRRFNADPNVIGQSITLDGNPHTVVGVAPPRFTFPERQEVWLPQVEDSTFADPTNRGAHYLSAVGRLKPGATVAQASAEIAAIASRLATQYPNSNKNFGGRVVSLRDSIVGDVRPALYTLLGAVGFVLLIACANVANLLLVRAAGRETEMAIRTALGAGRGRIVRQLVTESLLLATVGGALGVLVAAWGVDLLKAAGPTDLPRLQEVGLDGTVLLFAVAVSLVTGLVFGLVPALHAARPNLNNMLKEGGRGVSAGPGARMRSGLVIAEMALAVVLLAGAGLLINSFARLSSVDPGFRTEHVVTFQLSPAVSKHGSTHRLRQFFVDLEQRLRAIPGVQSAGGAFGLPMGGAVARTGMEIEGKPRSTPDTRRIVDVSVVTPGYIGTMGIPLLKGRTITESDNVGAPRAVLINQEAARKYFPGEDPIGKHITLGWTAQVEDGKPSERLGGEVVGVVANVKQESLRRDPIPVVYSPYQQTGELNYIAVVVRSTTEPGALGAQIRQAIRELDPDLPIQDYRTLRDLVGESVARPRFYTVLLGGFAFIALVLASVGIYGVLSYLVAQRTRELGIRVALGASAGQVLSLVMRRGLALTGAGVAVGVLMALAATRLLASLLFGVGATDPVTFGVVSATLMGVAALACWLPARRAARVDPVVALKAE
ncbi:MAG: ABC transporter permease [Gemmatimonadaceae bacterium]